MERKNYYALDVAKYVCAFLVISIHTAPFASINMQLHIWMTQVIARIAVPLYFMISGYLFFSKIDAQREWNDQENLYQFKRYIFRILKIYGIWSILDVPFSFMDLYRAHFSLTSIGIWLRDILFSGTFYHLWFLPALILGMCIVYYLRKWCSMKQIVFISVCLYIIGMSFNIYSPLLQDVPYISTVYTWYEQVFVTTRNGLFFAPVFLALGGYYANMEISLRFSLKSSWMLCIGALVLYVKEAMFLQHVHLLNDYTCMYFTLLFVCPSLLLVLLQTPLIKRNIYHYMRITSLLIYVSHLFFILVCDKVLPDLALWEVYVVTSICSIIFSTLIYIGAKKFTILKILY